MKNTFAAIGLGSAIGFGLVAIFTPMIEAKTDNGLMTNVPGFGKSRVETVSYCLTEAQVTKYQDLVTDTQTQTFGRCMSDNT